jgi:hypothetical protein
MSQQVGVNCSLDVVIGVLQKISARCHARIVNEHGHMTHLLLDTPSHCLHLFSVTAIEFKMDD